MTIIFLVTRSTLVVMQFFCVHTFLGHPVFSHNGKLTSSILDRSPMQYSQCSRHWSQSPQCNDPHIKVNTGPHSLVVLKLHWLLIPCPLDPQCSVHWSSVPSTCSGVFTGPHSPIITGPQSAKLNDLHSAVVL